MWPTPAPLSSGFLQEVAEPAARSLVLACFAGAMIGAFRVRAVSWKAAIWRGVLIAALAMPLLGSFLPPVGVPVPLLNFESRAPIARHAETRSALPEMPVAIAADGHARPSSINVTPFEATSAAPAPHVRRSIPWFPILISIYLGVAFLLLARIFVGAAFGDRLVRSAKPVSDADALRSLSSCARNAGLRSQPLLAESESIAVPVTLRVTRPALLLPESWREWDDAKLRAVLAHELSHIVRRDGLVQRLALLHRAIFWFSPLGWWLVRHLNDLAERASDEAALACGIERIRYAEALLGFVATLENCRSRVWWDGAAMAKRGRAEKRLDRILGGRNAMPKKLRKSVFVGLVVLAAPLVALTASVHPRFVNVTQTTAPSLQSPSAPTAAPAPNPAIRPIVNPMPSLKALPSAPALAAAPAAPSQPAVRPVGAPTPQAPNATPVAPPAAPAGAATPAVAPMPSAPAETVQFHKESVFDGGSGLRFAIITKDEQIGSGAPEAMALRSKIPGDFIWFERDEKPYVIRDQATVQRAKQLWQPVEDLGRQQADLGQQQALLGQTEANIGRQIDEVRVKIPDLSAQMEKLAAEMKQLSASGGTVEQIGDLQSRIGEVQSQLGEVESEAGRRQAEIGRQQAEMGREQAALGRQQGELGQQQAELSRAASQQMKQLLDDAMARGLAKPE